MSNSFEYLQSSITEIQKNTRFCLILLQSMVVRFMAQRDRDPKTGLIALLVYYEVPEGKREEVKQKFSNYSRNITISQQQ